MLQSTLADELATLRNSGAYGLMPDLGMLEIYGADAQRFLQAQTTNDVVSLDACSAQMSCLLDRKAHVQAFFTLYKKHDSFRILAEKSQIPKILNHLDKFCFNDKVEFIDITSGGTFITVQGPKSLACVLQIVHGDGHEEALKNDLCDLKVFGKSAHIFRKSLTGEEGYLLRVHQADLEPIFHKVEAICADAGMTKLTSELLQVARIESGLPIFGLDFDGENLLPELGLDELAVSFSKGCYQGQEVVARVKNQGAPSRGFVGLQFDGRVSTNEIKKNEPLVHNGSEIGWIKSSCFSPSLNSTIALGFVKRDFRTPDKPLTVQIFGEDHAVQVKTLPFVKPVSAKERAKSIYEKALDVYAKEPDDADANSQSVQMFRQALSLDPKLEDAYEALGVVLSKRDRLPEAVALMQTLAKLNPDSVMAHTNLSVFYVEQGLKEKAEDEKAISLSIRMRLAAKQANQEIQDKELKKKAKEETEARMEMFKQVLDIDADDLLANYGIGSCYVALEEPLKAIPFLSKALEIKPSYTVAYLALGQAYEKLMDKAQAEKIYEDGISVAAKRGELSPMNDMQSRLTNLRNSKT